MDDLLQGTSSGDVARGPGEKVPAGHYPALRLLKMEVFRAQTGRKARCFKAVSEVVEAANGKKPGDRVEQFCQLEFNTHEYYDKDSRAQVMQLLGALHGYGTIQEIDQHITGKTLAEVAGPTQPKTGTVYAADVSYKNPESIFAKWLCRPAGTPQTTNTPSPSPSPTNGTGGTNGPGAAGLPVGWRVHPADSRFIFNEANPQEMRQIA